MTTRTLVVLDETVFHPAPVRDLLLRVGATGLYEPRWSTSIVAAHVRDLLGRRLDLDAAAVARTQTLLTAGFEGWCIDVPDELGRAAGADDLNAPTIAAAMATSATAIVTASPARYATDAVSALGLRTTTPDAFLAALVDASPKQVLACVRDQAAALATPQPLTALKATLKAQGLEATFARLAEHYGEVG